MAPPPRDRSVFEEPHLTPQRHEPDPTEQTAGRSGSDDSLAALDSVANEPWFSSREDVGPTYGDWLDARRAAMSRWRSWLIMATLALAAGPFAIVGAFWGSGQTAFSIVALTIFGPLVEEMSKVGVILITIERRPHLVRSAMQIMLTGFAAGLAFAVVENLLYLHVYVPDPPASLVYWRWTVCVALHVACALIASMGVLAIWRGVWRDRRPARVERGFPFFIAAMIVHGLYNLFAILIETFSSTFSDAPTP